jgi:hypothetical protein
VIGNCIQYKKDIGNRFRIFRQLVLKTRGEFADEASLPEEYITQIEWGTVIPGILSIEYFYKEYGLNLTWLISGEENIFYKMGPKTPRHAYQLDRTLDYRDPQFSQYLKVVKEMQIPEVKEDVISLMKLIKKDYRQFFDVYEKQRTNNKNEEREVTHG